MSWRNLDSWWLQEVSSDLTYESVITPLLLEVLQPDEGSLYIDLGCGDGRLLRHLSQSGARGIGLDVNENLVRLVGKGGLVAQLPEIPIADSSVDGAYSTLVLEHIRDHRRFFDEAARVTRSDGILALVINHPIWTAPESTPITDVDGEVLWRPGEYFSNGLSEVEAGEAHVVFHHRTMSELFNSAAESSWVLEYVVEQPHHELSDQAGIPRLLGCRWKLSD